MPVDISTVSSNPTLREYAQGAARQAIDPVAEFVSPTVEVSSSLGKFKIYDEKNRLYIPNTLFTPGGKATVLQFEKSDGNYNCDHHAIDIPTDDIEEMEEADLVATVQENSDDAADIAALAHAKQVIDMAYANAANTAKTWNTSADPIADLNAQIKAVLKAGRGIGVRVLFGVDAWEIFMNHSKVAGKFIVGNGKSGAAYAIPNHESAGSLLLGNPETHCSFMVHDANPQGQDPDIQFISGSKILIFAAKARPTRRDPSAMKTFRLRGRWMKPGTYRREDDRGTVTKMDWSEDTQVGNAAALKTLTISAS